MSDLTPFHLTALAKFNGKRALTETGLARELRCEKAVAKHAIRVLLGANLLKNVGTYEFAITHDGVLKLGGKPKPAQVVKEVKLEELEVIDLPETSHDHVADIAAGMGIVSDQAQEPCNEAEAKLAVTKAQADLAEAKLNKVVVVPDAQTADQLAEQLAPLPAAEQADFDTLVLQGLARLNRQLGMQPVTIQDASLKVETLAALADAIGRTEPHVSIVLKAIINDIQHINGRVG